MAESKGMLSTEVLSLPEVSWTRAKYEFSPDNDMWVIPDASQDRFFNFSVFCDTCSDELILYLKKTLLWYLRERSTPHANNMFKQFKYLIEGIAGNGRITGISAENIISYKGNLPKGNEWYLSGLSGFLRRWYEMGYPGVTPEAYALLGELRLHGNRKGWAVLTFDPEEGPFDEIELHGIHEAVNSAYAEGEIGNRAFSLVWLFMATGARPVQVAALKVKDFFVQRGENGKMEYMVNIPRAKQRNTVMRKLFKLRRLIPEVGTVLEAWIAQIKLEYTKNIADGLPEGELPLFPIWHKENVPGFAHHPNGDLLSNELREVFIGLRVNSHRTGQPMHINPRRFRYTLGTRTAMEKHGEMVIAEILDHTDTQNAKVYVQCVPEIIEHLDQALAEALAPLADAFAGKVVRKEADTTYSDDPTRLIRHPKLAPAQGGVGSCGTGCGECGAHVPVACYVCRDFQAWLDAPHEEVLNDLLKERQEWMATTEDERTAYANDNVILAVAQVVQKCRELREGNLG